MPFVSEMRIEQTWQRIGSLGGREIFKLQKQHRKVQKALTMFVYSVLDDFRKDACGVLIYVFHVVVEAFRAEKPRLNRVSRSQIDAAWGKQSSEQRFDFSRAVDVSPEPFVLTYVYDAFTEEIEDVVLSESEREMFLAMLQTVIECLHTACQSK